jgi:hypothetical protein
VCGKNGAGETPTILGLPRSFHLFISSPFAGDTESESLDERSLLALGPFSLELRPRKQVVGFSGPIETTP